METDRYIAGCTRMDAIVEASTDKLVLVRFDTDDISRLPHRLVAKDWASGDTCSVSGKGRGTISRNPGKNGVVKIKFDDGRNEEVHGRTSPLTWQYLGPPLT
jgi:hypothetical protein